MRWLLHSPQRLYGALGGTLAVLLVLVVVVVAVRAPGGDAQAVAQPGAIPAGSAVTTRGDAGLLERADRLARQADPRAVATDAVRREHPDVAVTASSRLVAAEGSVAVVDVRTDAGTARVTMLQTPASYEVQGIAWR